MKPTYSRNKREGYYVGTWRGKHHRSRFHRLIGRKHWKGWGK